MVDDNKGAHWHTPMGAFDFMVPTDAPQEQKGPMIVNSE